MEESLMFIAKELFYSKGYFKTRISDITQKRGVSPANFYRYFTSKEEILREIIREETSDYIKNLESTVKRRSQIYDKIYNILDINLVLTFEKPNFLVLMDELEKNNHKVDCRTMSLLNGINGANDGVLKKVLEEGGLNPREKKLACQLISSTITTFNDSLIKDDNGVNRPEKIKFLDQEKKRCELTQLITQMCRGLNVPNDIIKYDLETLLYTKEYLKELLDEILPHYSKKAERLYIIYLEVPVIRTLKKEKSFFYECYMKEVGKRIKETFRVSDLAARVDDSNFMIVLPDYQVDCWEGILDRIRAKKREVEKRFTIVKDKEDKIMLFSFPTKNIKDAELFIMADKRREEYMIKSSELI